MRFDIITIFPHIFDSYSNESILKRARTKKLVSICTHDLRKYTKDRHHKVDDKPFGGGPGMVLKIEPIVKAIKLILKNSKSETRNSKQIRKSKSQMFKKQSRTLIVVTAAGGKQFTAKTAASYTKKYDRVIIICGHYEGIDARLQAVLNRLGFKVENISVGPYVLTGGELPAMIMIDAISRYIPGGLGKSESLEEKRHGVGVSTYTRPETFTFTGKKYSVPKLLLSGHHKKIAEWREKHKK